MPDGVTVKIDGLQALERNLNRLAEDVAKKHGVDAVRAGARVIQRLALANARGLFRSRTGLLFKSIGITVRIFGRGVSGATIWSYIGLKRAPGALGLKLGEAWYGRVLETGWRSIGRSKKMSRLLRRKAGSKTSFFGRKRKGQAGLRFKQVDPRPWLRPAFERGGGAAIEALAARLRRVFGG